VDGGDVELSPPVGECLVEQALGDGEQRQLGPDRLGLVLDLLEDVVERGDRPGRGRPPALADVWAATSRLATYFRRAPVPKAPV
jgi:hypothetical protein